MKNNEVKVSFKKQKAETGLGGVGYPHSSVDIKFDKKIIGRISAPNWQTPDNLWRLIFYVKEGNGFRNITLKKTCENEEEAREFVKEHAKELAAKYTFHVMED